MRRFPWLSFIFLALLIFSSAMVLARATPAFAGTLERAPATVGQALAPHPFQPLAPAAPQLRADAQGQAVAAPTDVTPDEVLQVIAQAVESKNWGLLACALVLGAVYGLRRFLSPGVPWLASDGGGVVLSLVTAAALSLSATLAAGKPLTIAVVLGALATAAGASGLWTWGRKLFGAKPAAQTQAKA